jgi:uncharacterized protein
VPGALLLLLAAITLPAKPDHYVTDRAGVIKNADALNEKLANFERQTSDQILVYTDQHLPADTTIEEMGAEAIKTWGVGQKGKDNGAILFVFVGDRKMRIEVGYGLEGSLTDAKAKWITSTVIKPEFQRGDFSAGINNGVDAMLATVRGEPYRGTGATVAQTRRSVPEYTLPFWVCPGTLLLLFGLVGYAVFASIKARKLGRSWGGVDPIQWTSSGSSGSSSSSSSDSSSSFDGGGWIGRRWRSERFLVKRPRPVA